MHWTGLAVLCRASWQAEGGRAARNCPTQCTAVAASRGCMPCILAFAVGAIRPGRSGASSRLPPLFPVQCALPVHPLLVSRLSAPVRSEPGAGCSCLSSRCASLPSTLPVLMMTKRGAQAVPRLISDSARLRSEAFDISNPGRGGSQADRADPDLQLTSIDTQCSVGDGQQLASRRGAAPLAGSGLKSAVQADISGDSASCWCMLAGIQQCSAASDTS